VFTSSVSTLRSGSLISLFPRDTDFVDVSDAPLTGPAKEVVYEDPNVAIGAGYSESKWVVEVVLSRVSSAIPALHTTVARVGQLSGGKADDWNTAERFPSLVASGPVVNCLPEMNAVSP
jgi:thioester reductase-like protein